MHVWPSLIGAPKDKKGKRCERRNCTKSVAGSRAFPSWDQFASSSECVPGGCSDDYLRSDNHVWARSSGYRWHNRRSWTRCCGRVASIDGASSPRSTRPACRLNSGYHRIRTAIWKNPNRSERAPSGNSHEINVSVQRTPAFVATTPYASVSQVVCYDDTWTTHIPSIRRSSPDVMQIVTTTLQAPSVIVAGTTNPTYLAFVNQEVISERTGSPFVVFVDPSANPMPALASFSYRKDFRDLTRHLVLWQP